METLTQMTDRLAKDHGWNRYTALSAAEYYKGMIPIEELRERGDVSKWFEEILRAR